MDGIELADLGSLVDLFRNRKNNPDKSADEVFPEFRNRVDPLLGDQLGDGLGSDSTLMGLCICSNCLVAVPEDRFAFSEKFQRFDKVLSPGLHWTGLDCCGCCVSFRSVSTRIEMTYNTVHAKTKDNSFVHCQIAIQHSIDPSKGWEAIYKLSSVAQIDAFAVDVVTQEIASFSLEDLFESTQNLSRISQGRLDCQLHEFGIRVHNVLVTDLIPDGDLEAVWCRLAKERRLREAAIIKADADKIRVVARAVADAHAAELFGEGTARSFQAILKGLYEAMMLLGAPLEDANEFAMGIFLTSEYFSTLKDVAGKKNSSVVFLPEDCREKPEVPEKPRQLSLPSWH